VEPILNRLYARRQYIERMYRLDQLPAAPEIVVETRMYPVASRSVSFDADQSDGLHDKPTIHFKSVDV